MSGDLRTLGYSDAMAWALVWVKQEIAHVEHRPIRPDHCRKLAQRKRQLAPLLELQSRFKKAYDEAIEAYDKGKSS